MKNKMIWICSVSMICLVGFLSCSKKALTGPNFIFKDSTDRMSAAKVDGKMVSNKDVFSGMESDIYEAQMKVYELKMGALKAYLLKKYIDTDKRSKGLTQEQFIDKYVATSKTVTEEQVKKFIKEKKIPSEHLNDKMKERIKKYLSADGKRAAVEAWINDKTAKSPVEVYIPKPARPVFEVEVGDSPFWGGKDAKVTIVEYSDFQCPFCSKAAKIVDDLKKKYGNKIKVVFKQFPLSFHNHAKKAAEASLCANEQSSKNFWKFHDAMFAEQSKLSMDDLKATAKKLGLDTATFDKCLTSGKFSSKVDAEMESGKKVSVKSTPTFFVNGILLSGAQSVEVFSELIDEQLKK
ncbi:DsbA family protein [bacterium]|nr:DsbA family protein [bacterium]